ncbi:MAG: cytochrome c biogenesis protein CcsA [Thermodesulfobacteriota bacterium]|nr:cytochrome c biogenesis protein CcsA [Thermodesulfobacteriota bacterium]
MIQNSFLLATIFYLLGFCASIAKKKHLTGILLLSGLVTNACSITMRYFQTLPMMPLYQAPFFLPFCLGLFAFAMVSRDRAGKTETLFIMAILSCIAALFPKDHYLPFLQFKTVLAHLFFIFGIIGRTFFLLSGILAYLVIRQRKSPFTYGVSLKDVRQFVIWGYVLFTMSIFSGAIWSYLGWGTPVVWDDPGIVTAMSTWLYYSLYLHLHLIAFGNVKNRPYFALFGAVWVTIFNWLPDMGRFMLPMIFIK